MMLLPAFDVNESNCWCDKSPMLLSFLHLHYGILLPILTLLQNLTIISDCKIPIITVASKTIYVKNT